MIKKVYIDNKLKMPLILMWQMIQILVHSCKHKMINKTEEVSLQNLSKEKLILSIQKLPNQTNNMNWVSKKIIYCFFKMIYFKRNPFKMKINKW